MAESKVNNVVAAIAKVSAAMAAEGLSKDRVNKEQNFKFRGIDDVLNALARHYAAAGLIVVPSYETREVSQRQTASGKAQFNVVVCGKFLCLALDGSSLVAGPFYGEALDMADKATNKAMSAAYKYFAIQTFAIPTEGDNDADAHAPEESVPPVDLKPYRDALEKIASIKGLSDWWQKLQPNERVLLAADKDAAKARIAEAEKLAAETANA